MQSLLDLYIDWAGPNVLSAMAVAAIGCWLLGLYKSANLMTLLMTTGFAVVAVILISIAATLLGVPPMLPPGVLGAAAGALTAIVLKARS